MEAAKKGKEGIVGLGEEAGGGGGGVNCEGAGGWAEWGKREGGGV